MSAYGLLNLLNKCGKREKMQSLPSILSLFLKVFNNCNNAGAQPLDYILNASKNTTFEIYPSLDLNLF